MDRYYVTTRPCRPSRPLFEAATLTECLDWVRDHHRPGREEVMVSIDQSPPEDGDDVFVCLPAWFVGIWRERAAEVIASWEARWLLIESAPPRHRGQALGDLTEVVAAALATAVAEVTSSDEDVGF